MKLYQIDRSNHSPRSLNECCVHGTAIEPRDQEKCGSSVFDGKAATRFTPRQTLDLQHETGRGQTSNPWYRQTVVVITSSIRDKKVGEASYSLKGCVKAIEDMQIKTEIISSKDISGGIVDFAEENNIGLIAIGTRGRSGFKKLLLGSVASHVVIYAHCPVLVVDNINLCFRCDYPMIDIQSCHSLCTNCGAQQTCSRAPVI